jgi:hypothetical protein
MKNEIKICEEIITLAKARGNKVCQVSMFGSEDTFIKLREMGYKAQRIGFEIEDPNVHIQINW